MGRTSSIILTSLVGIVSRTLAVDKKVWCFGCYRQEWHACTPLGSLHVSLGSPIGETLKVTTNFTRSSAVVERPRDVSYGPLNIFTKSFKITEDHSKW